MKSLGESNISSPEKWKYFLALSAWDFFVTSIWPGWHKLPLRRSSWIRGATFYVLLKSFPSAQIKLAYHLVNGHNANRGNGHTCSHVSKVWVLGSQISVLECCNLSTVANANLIIALVERWINSGKSENIFY